MDAGIFFREQEYPGPGFFQFLTPSVISSWGGNDPGSGI
jgi:hypothetical protein